MKLKIILSFLFGLMVYMPSHAQSFQKNIRGLIIDNDKEPIPYANIRIGRTNEGTFSNEDGEFSLNIDVHHLEDSLHISAVGFDSQSYLISKISSKRFFTVKMKAFARELDEVVVTPKDMREIIREAVEKIPENYHQDPVMLKGFFRNMLMFSGEHAEFTEAVVDIYKQGVLEHDSLDQLKLLKARSLVNDFELDGVGDQMDSIDMDMPGAANDLLRDDIVKNNGQLFGGDGDDEDIHMVLFMAPEWLDYYHFEFEGLTNYQDRTTMIVSFKPRWKVNAGMFEGTILLDNDTYAFARIQFHIPDQYLKHIIPIKGLGKSLLLGAMKFFGGVAFNFRIEYLRGISEYQLVGDKWTTQRVSREFGFFLKLRYPKEKIDFKHVIELNQHLFMLDASTNAEEIPKEEQLTHEEDIKRVMDTYDEAFWQNFNVVEVSKDLEKALKNFEAKKLNR